MSVRPAVVAGQFYRGDPQGLRRDVDAYIAESDVSPMPERVAAMIVPHAGFIYSGPTAGFGYARVRGKRPKRVVLLGCSHRYAIETASVFESGGFETPLGVFPIDEPFAKALAAKTHSCTAQPHMYEHALEVQLPFLWAALGEVPIVPVLFGGPANAWHEEVGTTLAGMLDPQDLVIASTDLSHYLSEEEANAIDRHSIDTILSQDCKALVAGIAEDECSMCGGSAVVAAMACALARGATSWSLLDYRTSAKTSGDYSRVVGYAAITMEYAA